MLQLGTICHQQSRAISRDTSRAISRDTSRAISRDTSRAISHDTSHALSRDTSHAISRDQLFLGNPPGRLHQLGDQYLSVESNDAWSLPQHES